MALRAVVFLVILIISAASFAIPSSYAAGFDLSELKAYYPFEEDIGDLINEAANAGSLESIGIGADGQLEAGVMQGQTGLIGSSYFFPKTTNGQVNLGTSKSQFRFLHDSPTMTWSTNIWIKTSSASSQTLFSTGGGSTSDVGMDLFYDGRTVFERIGVVIPQGILFQPNVIAANTPIGTLAADGQWHMITVTHDHNLASNNMKIYVDGTFISSATKSAIPPVATNHDEVATIGISAGAGVSSFFAFNGNLDEFSIWNRVLNPSEILDLYNNGAGLTFIDNNQVVGGEIIPIEVTSLILAGAQTPAVWMISAFSALGIGAFWFTRNPYNVRNIKVIFQDYLDRF